MSERYRRRIRHLVRELEKQKRLWTRFKPGILREVFLEASPMQSIDDCLHDHELEMRGIDEEPGFQFGTDREEEGEEL